MSAMGKQCVEKQPEGNLIQDIYFSHLISHHTILHSMTSHPEIYVVSKLTCCPTPWDVYTSPSPQTDLLYPIHPLVSVRTSNKPFPIL